MRSIIVSWGGVRLSPLGTSATNWPIVPAPDDRWWVWSSRWNENWQGNRSTRRKPAPVPLRPPQILPDLGSNPWHHGGKPVANRLSYVTAMRSTIKKWRVKIWTALAEGSYEHGIASSGSVFANWSRFPPPADWRRAVTQRRRACLTWRTINHLKLIMPELKIPGNNRSYGLYSTGLITKQYTNVLGWNPQNKILLRVSHK
jgi:hypothetical protein